MVDLWAAKFAERLVFTALFLLLVLTGAATPSQTFPKQISGYEVYRSVIRIDESSQETRRVVSPLIEIENPGISGTSITGISISVQASLRSAGLNGLAGMIIFDRFMRTVGTSR